MVELPTEKVRMLREKEVGRKKKTISLKEGLGSAAQASVMLWIHDNSDEISQSSPEANLRWVEMTKFNEEVTEQNSVRASPRRNRPRENA